MNLSRSINQPKSKSQDAFAFRQFFVKEAINQMSDLRISKDHKTEIATVLLYELAQIMTRNEIAVLLGSKEIKWYRRVENLF